MLNVIAVCTAESLPSPASEPPVKRGSVNIPTSFLTIICDIKVLPYVVHVLPTGLEHHTEVCTCGFRFILVMKDCHVGQKTAGLL